MERKKSKADEIADNNQQQQLKGNDVQNS